MPDNYRAPGWFTRRVFNPLVAFLTRQGISVLGSRVLAVKGRVGRRAESFRGRELADDEKVPVLRAYLRRWKAEVGIFFEGTGPDSTDDQLLAIAAKHPAFEVLPAQ